MLKKLERILTLIAKYRLKQFPNVSISSSAKVNFRRISLGMDSSLTIGDGSIVEGTIKSDRDGAQISIGENTFIGASHIVSAERIEIGNDVLVAWGCWIVDHNSHAISCEQRRDDVKHWYYEKKEWKHVVRKPIKICNKAWVGFNSIILKGITVGEGAIVGAGSVVTQDVPPYTIVAGNPARVIREIPLEERS